MLLRSTLLGAAAVSVAALAPVVAGAAPARAPAAAGSYEGLAFDAGEEPSPKEWVRFRVSGDGRSLRRFSTRLWMICYVGPPTYNITLPTVISAPRAPITRRGKVDRHWREPYTADGETYELEGHLTLRFRARRPVTGKIRVEFDGCGTTTGDPPGYMRIRADRSR